MLGHEGGLFERLEMGPEAWFEIPWGVDGKDWAQVVTLHPPKKDEVFIALLKMTRHPTKHLLKKDTWTPSQYRGIGSYGS